GCAAPGRASRPDVRRRGGGRRPPRPGRGAGRARALRGAARRAAARLAGDRAGDRGATGVKICLPNEHFPPFAPGGAEWRTEALARALAGRGHDVLVVTPNYGAASREERDGFRVLRFPFPLSLSPGRALVSAKWLANPLFYLYAAAMVVREMHRERFHVIHVQNKHMLIPGALAS